MSIRDQTCPNKNCLHYEQQGEGNVIIHGAARPRFKCTRCGKTWAGHRKEIHYGLRATKEEMIRAISLLQDGASIRGLARELQKSPSTIQRWKKRM